VGLSLSGRVRAGVGLSCVFFFEAEAHPMEPRDDPAAAGCRTSCIEETASTQSRMPKPSQHPNAGLHHGANGPHWVDPDLR